MLLSLVCACCGGAVSLPATMHQRLVAIHAEDTLGSACIAQVIDLPFAIAATETSFAEGLLAGEDGEILDLIPTGGATVGTTAADQGAIPKEEKVSVGVEEGSAGAAPETIDVPSVAG